MKTTKADHQTLGARRPQPVWLAWDSSHRLRTSLASISAAARPRGDGRRGKSAMPRKLARPQNWVLFMMLRPLNVLALADDRLPPFAAGAATLADFRPTMGATSAAQRGWGPDYT
jgi:hypothetical protein